MIERINQKPEYSKLLMYNYKNRLQFVKQGQMLNNMGNFAQAIISFEKYLNTIAQVYNIEVNEITPKLFVIQNPNDETKSTEDIHEIFLISLITWNLAKIYGKSGAPKHVIKAKEVLDKYVLFSLGYKFQYLSCINIKKFLKSVHPNQKTAFHHAYSQLKVHSKSCYIATFCYGPDHPNLTVLRKFRDIIINYKIGEKFVNTYYQISPKLVRGLQSNYYTKKMAKFFITPLLNCMTKIIHRFIIK